MARQSREGADDVNEWRKSSYSTPSGSNCVEVGPATAYVGVRDTKNRTAGVLAVSRATWAAFAAATAADRFAAGR